MGMDTDMADMAVKNIILTKNIPLKQSIVQYNIFFKKPTIAF